MPKKLILYIAMTLDGYIADENDQLSFLDPFNEYDLAKTSYQDLLNRTDVLFIGRKTYEVVRQQVDVWPYPNHQTYVFSSKPGIDTENITFTSKDISELINNLKKTFGKDIWVVGGGKLVQSLMALDLIDEYHIAIAPILLGKGVPLFREFEHQINLKLEKIDREDQLTMLILYRK